MKKVIIDKAYLYKALPPPKAAYEEETLSMLNALDQNKEGEVVRKKLSFALVLTILLIVLLAGLALAAINWGSREFITHTDSEGITHINEALANIIEPVGQVFESDALKVTVIDAAYDGRSVVMSWTVENKLLDTAIYFSSYPTYNGDYGGTGSGWDSSGPVIGPGETITSALSTTLVENEQYDAETCEIILHMTALAPNGPLVTVEFPSTPAEEAVVDALIAEGKVVVYERGHILTGNLLSQAKYQDMDYIEALVESGYMRRVDTMDISFMMAKNVDAQVGVADRTEIDFGDLTIRLVEAVKTPNTVTILLDVVFEDEAMASQYEGFGVNPLVVMLWQGSHSKLKFKDGIGNDYFAAEHMSTLSFSSVDRVPVEQPDGTWTWRVMVTAVDFLYADDTCRIVVDVPIDLARKQYEEQVMTIKFE